MRDVLVYEEYSDDKEYKFDEDAERINHNVSPILNWYMRKY